MVDAVMVGSRIKEVYRMRRAGRGGKEKGAKPTAETTYNCLVFSLCSSRRRMFCASQRVNPAYSGPFTVFSDSPSSAVGSPSPHARLGVNIRQPSSKFTPKFTPCGPTGALSPHKQTQHRKAGLKTPDFSPSIQLCPHL
jgi:hypothetical protein